MNAGLAAAALAGLSSCTNYGANQAPTGGGSSVGGGAAGGSTITAKTADIPVGGGKIFVDKNLNQHAVITQPSEGEFKAFTSICTHAQCDVSEVTTTINCRACHGSQFSITDGSVVKQPAPGPLAAKTIKLEGDTITVT
jgi:Rieske Fe-S protein